MRKKLNKSSKNCIDYYPFGMPMPNRQIVNGKPYRYAYQGQEKDPETGKEAFQLRLWDGRIGRWLSPDPAGQFHSPYLGMGNSAMNGIESGGADWWRLTKDGSLVLINRTNDKFNVFFDTEGFEITSTNKPMDYMGIFDNRKKFFKKNPDSGDFINMRIAQAQAISLAIYNNNAVYSKMVERAKETHWYNERVFRKMRKSGDIPSKAAVSSLFDITKNIVGFVAGGRVGKGLNFAQMGSLTYSFGGILTAVIDQSKLSELQKEIGNKLYNYQQNLMINQSRLWNNLQYKIPSERKRSWGDFDTKN